ncbi:acyl-CoA synthetase (AMP-forming)/AMP-acid ligase II [Defluviimonas denitrificans]|jgi:acyl-CoA synthetase (AMP-forming)/AMP-acid ligase II|uniref:Acyl-CoA synthetase (AMP-forming)/AMP-acid ligase II n=1 Tax=Albidovulum denitrificans TaxID=404881 RepID=A0A2S8S5I9_9RHOB|nr:AMP-binding protein [Defluviimonas denitrificans]PQV56055.1 acyl-CoA synthetase (AMP-forming)/AMP-acid ligase II [Defluviimonas denitrificans]
MNAKIDTAMTDMAHRADGFLPAEGRDADLRAAILARPDVVDAVVRRRLGLDGRPRRLAYLVSGRPQDAALPEALAAEVVAVPVSRIPRDASGAPDLAALATLPVIEAKSLGRGASLHTLDRMPAPDTGWTEEQLTPAEVLARPALLTGGPLPDAQPGVRTLADILTRAATLDAARGLTFLLRGDSPVELSYATLHAEALRIAGGLAKEGYGPGTPVICVYRDCEDRLALPAFWGAVYAGLVPVPLLSARRFSFDDAQVRRLSDAAELLPEAALLAAGAADAIRDLLPGRPVLVHDRLLAAAPRDVAHSADPGTPAAFFLTSGSTSKPKVVRQTHRAILSQVLGSAAQQGVTADDISLNWLPIDHVASIVMLHMRDLYVGARQIRAVAGDMLRDPLTWIDWLSQYRVTNGWAPNFAFGLVAADLAEKGGRDWDLRPLRFLLNGGEAVTRSTAVSFLDGLAPFGMARSVVWPAWGMSETCSGCVFNLGFDPFDGARGPVSVGLPSPGVALRIVDPANPVRVLRRGETGALQIGGATILDAYHNAPEKTAESFPEPGWFDTGDLGRIDDAGLSITGRQKDVLIVNGLNISPGEIEARLDRIAGVKPSCSAVLSLPDAEGGRDRIAVVFVPEMMPAEATLVGSIRSVLAAEHGLGADVVAALSLQEMPKTSIGKIQKEKLRANLLSGAIRPVDDPAGGETVPRLPTLWRETWEPTAAETGPLPEGITLCGTAPAGLISGLKQQGLRVGYVSEAALLGQEIGIVQGEALVMLPDAVSSARGAVGLVQGVLKLCRQARLRLLWVAPGLADGCAEAGMIAALLRSAEAETDGLSVRLIDPGAEPLTASCLAAELGDRARQTEVVWTGGQRSVRRLEALTCPRDGADPIRIARGGRYLVTGGLGGIGAALCAHLLDRGAQRLVLTGRRPESALNSDSRARLADLRRRAGSGAELVYRALDLGDADLGERLGDLRLDGIFHLAGLAQHAPVSEIRAQSLDAMFAAKQRGTAALAELASTVGADWLVCFGSLNGSFGGAGYGAYSMANRYQQAVAGKRHGCRIVSLNWSMWEDTGLSAGFAEKRLAEQRGYQVMAPSDALSVLDRTLASGVDSVHIGIDATRGAMAADLILPLAGLARVELGPETPATGVDPFGMPIPSQRRAEGKRLAGNATPSSDPVIAALCRVWQEVLRLPAPPAADDCIFSRGATSLDLPRAAERILDELGCDIDLLDLFERSRISDFAALLRG